MATFNEKKTCSQRMENFGRFLWNPDTSEFMGRTFAKWVYISLYYAAFYVIMIGIFALSIYSLMKTMNPFVPDYQDELKSPGVTMRPDPYGDEVIELFYNKAENSTYLPLVTSLCDFLSVYNKTVQEKMNANCSDNTRMSCANPKENSKSCQFTTDMLGNCSWEHDHTFGYKSGTPCLFIKMNRHGDLGDVHYYPGNDTYGTIGFQYFPYCGKKMQPNYTNPLVAVKLLNPPLNKELSVVCKVSGHGITSDNPHDPYEGKVSFKLKIEDKPGSSSAN
uniref:Sodium/potassium-transporting ATPase subunit beta n=1 Tax=Xenopus tropicalis TaxID=8364 RepID=A0A6I8QNQ4_XENTR